MRSAYCLSNKHDSRVRNELTRTKKKSNLETRNEDARTRFGRRWMKTHVDFRCMKNVFLLKHISGKSYCNEGLKNLYNIGVKNIKLTNCFKKGQMLILTTGATLIIMVLCITFMMLFFISAAGKNAGGAGE